MRNLTLFVIFLLIFSHLSAQWTALNSGTTLHFTQISQNATGDLLLVGQESSSQMSLGSIWKSDDAGTNWYNVAHHDKGFSTICFLPSGTALAIPHSTDSLFKSTDGGNTWAKQYSPNCNGPFRGFPNVSFTDNLTGYAPGYKTINGGDSWFSQFPEVQSFPYMPTDIAFVNDSTGIIAGYAYWAAMAKTTDRGNTWTWVNVPGQTWEIYAVDFPTAQIGYCTSQKSATIHEAEILKTIDGGDNWTSIYTANMSSLFLDIHCTDANTCYAVGRNGNITKTTDGGISWNTQPSGTTQTLNKVFFTDINTGYVVGESGTVLKTTNGGGTTGVSNPYFSGKEVSIYPNPSESGQFHFQIAAGGEAKKYELRIFNVLGEKILSETLNNEILIDISAYPNNLYFYQLWQNEGLVSTGKLLK